MDFLRLAAVEIPTAPFGRALWLLSGSHLLIADYFGAVGLLVKMRDAMLQSRLDEYFDLLDERLGIAGDGVIAELAANLLDAWAEWPTVH